jgi:uncharacterized membrane protein
MAPLMVLAASLIILRLVGLAVPALADWPNDTRYAMALMLLLTASAHFVPSTRAELIRMVPSALPRRADLVTLTGVLEVAAAGGLVLASAAPLAGAGLVLLLVAMFPANVKAAIEHLPLRGKSATPLVLRVPMQILFIAVTLWSSEPARLLVG